MTVKRTNEAMAKDALCIAGETVVPGTSLLVNGEVKSGLVHAGVGLAAKVALGPIGAVSMCLVAANSYCKSKTGDSLLTKFMTEKGPGDFSIREEVASAIKEGDSVETIIESVTEDVEDIYHELTLESVMRGEEAEETQQPSQESPQAAQ